MPPRRSESLTYIRVNDFRVIGIAHPSHLTTESFSSLAAGWRLAVWLRRRSTRMSLSGRLGCRSGRPAPEPLSGCSRTDVHAARRCRRSGRPRFRVDESRARASSDSESRLPPRGGGLGGRPAAGVGPRRRAPRVHRIIRVAGIRVTPSQWHPSHWRPASESRASHNLCPGRTGRAGPGSTVTKDDWQQSQSR